MDSTLSELMRFVCRSPRVARSSQPWAESFQSLRRCEKIEERVENAKCSLWKSTAYKSEFFAKSIFSHLLRDCKRRITSTHSLVSVIPRSRNEPFSWSYSCSTVAELDRYG